MDLILRNGIWDCETNSPVMGVVGGFDSFASTPGGIDCGFHFPDGTPEAEVERLANERIAWLDSQLVHKAGRPLHEAIA